MFRFTEMKTLLLTRGLQDAPVVPSEVEVA
jgi:hypothetical protein